MGRLDHFLILVFLFSATEWLRVNQLLQSAQWDLIFDLNVNLRHGNAWDPTNARALLRFSSDHGIKIPCFQLGNEPNWFRNKFHHTLSPQRLAQDYQLLRNLLNEFPTYRNSCIVGPEVTKLTVPIAKEYFEGFMQAEQHHHVLNAVGLHHYYVSSKTIPYNLSDLTSATLMDTLKEELQMAKAITHRYEPGLQVWLTETSATVTGGTGIVDNYVAGFMWLDKLGLSAQYGISHVIRQAFFYHLMDHDYQPLPDYFLTLLHKRLVRGPVLTVLRGTNEQVRVYANCANRSNNPAGAVTIYALNLQPHSVTLTFSQFQGQQLQLYMLTPGDQHGLSSRSVALNGKRLVMTNEELPNLPPVNHTGSVTMAAMTFGFLVIPHANVQVCKQ